MVQGISYRPLTAADRPLLEVATLGNLNWPGERFTLLDVRRRPEFAHYTVLDAARGDFGWAAVVDDEPVGVVWAQYLPADDAGYGYVADDVPELSVWVREGHRGRGVGRSLLRLLQRDVVGRGVAHVSLSVEEGSPAPQLYLTEGFVPVAGRAADGVMLWSVAASDEPSA